MTNSEVSRYMAEQARRKWASMSVEEQRAHIDKMVKARGARRKRQHRQAKVRARE